MFRLSTAAGLLLTMGVGLATGGAHQEATRENPAVMADSLSGPDMFRLYCAPCHGSDGKGRGPVALALKTRSPDLTEIARRNRGVFPKARVEGFVTNGKVGTKSAHGTADMPAWRPTFGSFDASDTRVKVRIDSLVDYIESIQSEVTVVSGSLTHHLLTNDLFHIDGLWMQVVPNTDFHRWLSQGIGRKVAITLTPKADRFADKKGVRILTGTLIHNTAPNASPIVHELFLKDPSTGAISAVTFETIDLTIAKTFDFYDGIEVSLVIQVA